MRCRHALAASDFARAARVIEATIPSVRKSRQDATLLAWLAGAARRHDRAQAGAEGVLRVVRPWSPATSPLRSPAWQPPTRRLSATTADGTPAHDSEAGEELRSLPVTIALYRAAIAQAQGDSGAEPRSTPNGRSTSPHPTTTWDEGLPPACWASHRGPSGDLESGVRAFTEARTSLRLAGNLADALSTTMVLADMLIPLGRLREAQRLYDEALRLARRPEPSRRAADCRPARRRQRAVP